MIQHQAEQLTTDPMELANYSLAGVEGDRNNIRVSQRGFMYHMLQKIFKEDIAIHDFIDYLAVRYADLDKEANSAGMGSYDLVELYEDISLDLYKLLASTGPHATTNDDEKLEIMVGSIFASLAYPGEEEEESEILNTIDEQGLHNDLIPLMRFQRKLNYFLNSGLFQEKGYFQVMENENFSDDPLERGLIYGLDVVARYINSDGHFTRDSLVEQQALFSKLNLVFKAAQFIRQTASQPDKKQEYSQIRALEIALDELEQQFPNLTREVIQQTIRDMVVEFEAITEHKPYIYYEKNTAEAALPRHQDRRPRSAARRVDLTTRRLQFLAFMEKEISMPGSSKQMVLQDIANLIDGKGRITQEERAKIIDMYLTLSGNVFKYTLAEIGKEFSLSKNEIHGIISNYWYNHIKPTLAKAA